jgi:hypothetical protein
MIRQITTHKLSTEKKIMLTRRKQLFEFSSWEQKDIKASTSYIHNTCVD